MDSRPPRKKKPKARRGTLAYPCEEAELWNCAYPPGTPVEVIEDDGQRTLTKTAGAAYVLTGTTAVIRLADRRGCFALYRVFPTEAPGQRPDPRPVRSRYGTRHKN